MNQEKAQELYEKLLAYAEDLHEDNKKRIHNGIISIFVLPVILSIVIWLTDSSRIMFLIIWIIATFAIAAYLISIAYIDRQLIDKIQELLDEEMEYDNLMGYGPEKAQERFKARHERFKAHAELVKERTEEIREELTEDIKEVIEKIEEERKPF